MKFTVPAALALALVAAAPASALTVGAGGATSSMPFNDVRMTGYQIVYNADAFDGAIRIGGVAFTATSGSETPDVDLTITWHLSSTAFGESSADLAANLGTELANWGVVRFGESASASPLEISGPAFDYDPAAGDLLLDIGFSNYVSPGATYLATSSTSDLYRNMTLATQAASFAYANQGSALVTTFIEASPVPLPGAGLLLAGGLGALGLIRGRRAA